MTIQIQIFFGASSDGPAKGKPSSDMYSFAGLNSSFEQKSYSQSFVESSSASTFSNRVRVLLYSSASSGGNVIKNFDIGPGVQETNNSSQSGLDAVAFFDPNLFCFLIGNADMHLKNFSLMQRLQGEMILAPAYDLLSTTLLIAEDKEEMALTVNWKKSRNKRKAFISLGKNLQIVEKSIDNSFLRLMRHISEMKNIIKKSFLSGEPQKRFNKLIDERTERLHI